MDAEQIAAEMAERELDLDALVERFRKHDQHIGVSWFAECVATTAVLLSQANNEEQRTHVLATLALAMWQAGYDAAPKLEFVLPEGAAG